METSLEIFQTASIVVKETESSRWIGFFYVDGNKLMETFDFDNYSSAHGSVALEIRRQIEAGNNPFLTKKLIKTRRTKKKPKSWFKKLFS